MLRFAPFLAVVAGAILSVVLVVFVSMWWWFALGLLGGLAILGVYDLLQTRHSVSRNYPILAHLRYISESIGPEVRQYFIEDDTEGRPFPREQRALVYERAKNINDYSPFGTELEVGEPGYEWINHSIAAHRVEDVDMRCEVGADRRQPYSCSLFNVSAMSYGAISPNAIRAMNKGAKKGGYYHTTGEGGLSPYHLEFGGDLVWQIGTGYFGCRTDDGHFDADLFRDQAQKPEVKMIELKLSQGAKPGHGGVLPGSKVSQEIADVRKVPAGEDCVSPPGHSVFHTPIEMMHFIEQLRELSGGKPVGFKLCLGDRVEFMAVCKATLETELYPDFITVDGAEGGTGAAPVEFSDHVGVPLIEGLVFVQNTLVGCGLRDRIRIAASGKVVTGFALAKMIALGADWCNAARGFMMAVGCIQARICHTNKCPVGVATTDALRQRALDVGDKGERAYWFHRNTMKALYEIVGAAGLDHAHELTPEHIHRRVDESTVRSFAQMYDWLEPNSLLSGDRHPEYHVHWQRARADSFRSAPSRAGRR